MHEANSTARLATAAGAADYLGVSVRTIARMVADGTIKPVRLRPKVVRFDLGEIERTLMEKGMGRRSA